MMMKKIRFLSCCLLLIACNSFGQLKLEYAAALIPDSLSQEVNAVIREQSEVLIIKKPGKGRQEIKTVITVLNENGNDALIFQEYMDKFRKIDDVDINIYDGIGNHLKRFKRKDLEKYAGDDGFSLITDGKMLYGQIPADRYPITVEYKYTINFEGFLEYPDFFPQTSGQSIIQASYSITTEKNNPIRFKNYRCTVQPVISTNGDNITHTWSVKNVRAFRQESGSAKRDVPRVQISPTRFEMDDYEGDMSSWESFGKWQIKLINQSNQLPENRQAFYRDLVKTAQTEREKVAILYKYLQQNFRYVSIQLGIGGWKPFPAEFVEKKKYGDCKALTNFMGAMLHAVNIESHYAIINAGYNDLAVDRDFPQSAFNHVILCVPLKTDTVWLECTSRTQPFGKLGNFTENKNAVLIGEKGGVLVATPKSIAADHQLTSHSFIRFSDDGTGEAKTEWEPQGEFADLTKYILESDEQRKKNYLINQLGFKQPDHFKIGPLTTSAYPMAVVFQMEYEKLPDFSAGPKHFINARLYKFWNRALPKSDDRQNAYYLEYPLIKLDTTVFQLPENYLAESLPKDANITTALAEYRSSYRFNPETKQITTTAYLQLKTHIIPAAIYPEMVQFFSEVIKEQQQKIIVKKEE